ncbi:unnamed protein product [Wuchereria bancrofti]|uniref:Uncharacterized protein n=1 Tax=Wuchereria bancrofti TaxID=6293 RepID=A0A3P7FLY1_WUCBA|nr:unnamed protein product [Wuchereria bancrofti]
MRSGCIAKSNTSCTRRIIDFPVGLSGFSLVEESMNSLYKSFTLTTKTPILLLNTSSFGYLASSDFHIRIGVPQIGCKQKIDFALPQLDFSEL